MPEPRPPLTFTADSIVDTVREPMLVLGADLTVRRANRSFPSGMRAVLSACKSPLTPRVAVGLIVNGLSSAW